MNHRPHSVLDDVLPRRAEYASTTVNIIRSEAQRHAALSRYNPQVSMFFATGLGYGNHLYGAGCIFHTPVPRSHRQYPHLPLGARFKTNRQQKAYIGIQKLQQSYKRIISTEELSATHKTDGNGTASQDSKENMNLAKENLDLVTFSYNEGKASMVDVLSAQLSWTQAHTNLINAYLSEKMAIAEYRKVISE